MFQSYLAEVEQLDEDAPEQEESKPVEEKPAPKKRKIVKKVKKDDDDDYIQRLIDMEIPKTELEVFEKPEFEETKKKRISPTTSEEEESKPQLVVEELPEEVVTLQVPTETGEVVEQKVTTRKIKKKQGDKEQIIEVKTTEVAGEEPETEVTIEEPQPIEIIETPEEILEIPQVSTQKEIVSNMFTMEICIGFLLKLQISGA